MNKQQIKQAQRLIINIINNIYKTNTTKTQQRQRNKTHKTNNHNKHNTYTNRDTYKHGDIKNTQTKQRDTHTNKTKTTNNTTKQPVSSHKPLGTIKQPQQQHDAYVYTYSTKNTNKPHTQAHTQLTTTTSNNHKRIQTTQNGPNTSHANTIHGTTLIISTKHITITQQTTHKTRYIYISTKPKQTNNKTNMTKTQIKQ